MVAEYDFIEDSVVIALKLHMQFYSHLPQQCITKVELGRAFVWGNKENSCGKHAY